MQLAFGAVQGSIAQDRLCIGTNATEGDDSGTEGCIGEPVKFVKVDNATHMDDYQCSGFVGLAPLSQIPGQSSFIEQVHESKTDGVPAVFSLYLSKDDYYYGRFVLGGYDLKYAASGLGS